MQQDTASMLNNFSLYQSLLKNSSHFLEARIESLLLLVTCRGP